jgi:hypothetical protein
MSEVFGDGVLVPGRCCVCAAERAPEASDHDVVSAQQTKLLLLSRRLCGVTVGRGMVTMSTLPVTLTEPLRVPVLALAARVPPTDAVITLDTSTVSVPCAVP